MMQENKNLPTDKELTIAIKNNDQDAFKKLYYLYFKSLITYALYRTHSSESAKELVQDVFTRIWIARDRLNPEKSIKSYLFKTLHNLLINVRSLHSSNSISLESISHLRNKSEIKDLDFAIDIQKAINRLPDKLKTVYLLCRVEGFKYTEIAEICGITEKGVEKRISLAFKSIKSMLSKNYLK